MMIEEPELSPELSSAVLNAADIGMWRWESASGEFRGSSVMARIFGVGRQPFALTADDYLSRVHPDDRSRLIAALRASSEGASTFRLSYRIQKEDGTLGWLLQSGVATADTARSVAGICIEISAAKQLEREAGIQHTIAQLVSESGDLQTIGPNLLRTLSESLGWDYGELWLTDESSDILNLEVSWARDPAIGRRFEEATRAIEFRRGIGIPGAVYATGEVWWEQDLANHPEHPRSALAKQLDLHSAAGFPVVYQNAIRGVLVFYARHRESQDESLTRLLSFAGSQLGQHLERVHALAALQASEARYRSLADTATDAILTVDPRGIIVYTNEAAERIFGYRLDEIIGSPLTQLMPERFRKAHRAGVERYMTTGEKRIPWTGVQLPGLHKDGHEIALEIAFSEFTSGGERFLTGMVRDISERQRDAAALRLLSDASRALSETIDADETLQTIAKLCVPQFADWCLIDLLDDEDRLRNTVIEHHDPDLLARARKMQAEHAWSETASGGPAQVLRTGEPELRQVDDHLLARIATSESHLEMLRGLGLVSLMCVPLVARSTAFGTLTLASAESRRVYDQTDLAVAQDLGYRIAAAIEKAELYSAAQALNRSKDEFLAQLSHELRTPITAVLGYTRLIREGQLEEDELREALASITSSAEAQARLVEDLLDVSRVITGKFHIESEPVELREVVEAAMAVVHPTAAAKGIRIVPPVPEAGCMVLGDASRLQQVIWNLLSNAIKFTPSKGEVRIRLECEESNALLEVCDTGQGIPAEFLPYVFDRFAQGRGAQAVGGLGLGLSVVRHLVELHGGTIEAHSEGVGRGATFRLRLPLRGAESGASE